MIKNMLAKILEIDTDCRLTEHYSEADKMAYTECLLKVARFEKDYPTDTILSFSNTTNTHSLFQRFSCILEVNWSEKNLFRILVSLLSLLLLLISLAFIVEPYYEFEDNSGELIFDLSLENCYLVEKDDYYELYEYDLYIGTITTLDEPFNKLKIYETEVKENEK